MAVVQSNYVPWRGYFDLIQSADLFVFHDDLQYTKGDWRNRNRLKAVDGPTWITVPVRHQSSSQLICDTEIDDTQPWRRRHLNVLRNAYTRAPFYEDALDILQTGLSRQCATISELNIGLIEIVRKYLKIETPTCASMELGLTGSRTTRLIGLMEKVGGAVYLSGPAARSYLEEDLFRARGIGLEYKVYDYPDYPQLWGEFEGAVSILDLIANVGPECRDHLVSRTPNQRVV